VSKRTERVADLIRRELADILMMRMRDPRLGFVSITGVEVSGDLTHATVYLSSLDGAEGRVEVVKVLSHAVPFLRRELAPRLGLREVPTLRFIYDESIERGARIEDLLRKIKDGTTTDDDDDGDGDAGKKAP
jgi:ribosome-binding factor A